MLCQKWKVGLITITIQKKTRSSGTSLTKVGGDQVSLRESFFVRGRVGVGSMCSQASSSSEDVPWSSGLLVKASAVMPSTESSPSGILGCLRGSRNMCSVAVVAQDPPGIAESFKFCTDKVLNVWPVYRLGCDQVVWCGGQRCFLDVPFRCIGSPSANQLDGF